MNNLISDELFNFYNDKARRTRIFSPDDAYSVLEFSSKDDKIFYGKIGDDYDAAYLAISKRYMNEKNESVSTLYKFSPQNEFTNGELRKDLDHSGMKKDVPFMNCIVDEIECHGFSDIYIKEFLSSYENAVSLLNNSFVEDKNIAELKQNINEYEDLLSYEEDLVTSGGDGYEKIFQKDLSDVSLKFSTLFHKIVLSLENEMVKNYFSYDDSVIEDLSIVNGVRCYVWNIDHYSNSFDSDLVLFIYRSLIDFYDIDKKYLPKHLTREIEQQEFSKNLRQLTQNIKDDDQELLRKIGL